MKMNIFASSFFCCSSRSSCNLPLQEGLGRATFASFLCFHIFGDLLYFLKLLPPRDAPKRPPRAPKSSPRSAPEPPRSTQGAPKSSPGAPQSLQRASEECPRAPKERPRAPKEPSRVPMEPSKEPRRARTCPQDLPKMPPAPRTP